MPLTCRGPWRTSDTACCHRSQPCRIIIQIWRQNWSLKISLMTKMYKSWATPIIWWTKATRTSRSASPSCNHHIYSKTWGTRPTSNDNSLIWMLWDNSARNNSWTCNKQMGSSACKQQVWTPVSLVCRQACRFRTKSGCFSCRICPISKVACRFSKMALPMASMTTSWTNPIWVIHWTWIY